MRTISDISNKNKIAIVVVGYNRLFETERLLNSLSQAIYPENEDVPLVISIDASGNESLYELVRAYRWTHGEKYEVIHDKKKGLKEHIFWCGDLTKYFKGVAIFEDDLYVSPYYFSFLVSALDSYANEPSVAGISLYNSPINSLYQIPFSPLKKGYSVYAYQDVATWGEAFNERMWYEFRNWLSHWKEDFINIDMPPIIKTWTRAWSKYHYAYMITQNKYFIFPYDSLVANFNDSAGEHGLGGNKWTSFSLLMGETKYNYAPFEQLVKYDSYCHNKDIYSVINISEDDLNIDFYGTDVHSRFPKKYLLSTSFLQYKVESSFALTMRPIELNIFSNLKGEGIYLYDTSKLIGNNTDYYPYEYISYQLQGFKPKLLYMYLKHFMLSYLKNIIKC